MQRRHALPIVSPEPPNPSVDRVRRRLGGRASTGPRAGEIVQTLGAPGVVLFAADEELHVLADDSTVRRTTSHDVSALADPPESLLRLAADVRAFAAVNEGERVSYETPLGERTEGTLVEKCRYGGLVLAADENGVGLGFRKIKPTGARP